MTPAIANPTAEGTPGAPGSDLYLQVEGARIRYRETGNGPAVILVHGWTLDLEMWDAQSTALAADFRVIRYDRRGFGLSTGIPSLQADVTDLEAICAQLGISRAAMVGMSQGARAVLGLAARAPERIACMVLDGPPGIDSDADEDAIPRLRALARAKGIDAFRHAWSAHPLMRLVTADVAAHNAVEAMIKRYPGRELISLAEPEPTSKLPPSTPTVPALVLTGEFDVPARVRAADALAAGLPAAERVTIPQAGHLANLDNPVLYNQFLGAFLRRHLPLKNPTPRSVL